MSSAVPHLFDTAQAELFRRRAARMAAANPASNTDFLLARAAADLQERLSLVKRRFARALDIYSHTDLAADAVRASGKAARIERAESFSEQASRYPSQICPAEIFAPQARHYDLITSLLSLHGVNDLPGLLLRIRRGLRPDGLFLAALCGAGTLSELRESLHQAESELCGGISPHIAPFPDMRECGALLQRAGFAMPVADMEELTIRYADMFALMRDLRAFGAQNALAARRRRVLPHRLFPRAAEIYAARFGSADGRITASFNIIWLSGWAPHESQQKPMRPGSAQASLAEVLSKKG